MSKDRKDVPYEAGWTENLRHRPDPNRVTKSQGPATAPAGRFVPRTGAAVPIPADPATLHPGRAAPGAGAPPSSAARAHDPQSAAEAQRPSYYDIPILKQPVWKWQIASYFYLGGISAGAYILGRAAERGGGAGYRDLSRIASYVAMGTLLPCPPLLIWDLGDPKRFHHMLRVWKPGSPMNFGTWAITAYGGMAAFEVVRQYLTRRDLRLSEADRSKLLKLMNNGLVLALHDLAGVPFSIIVAGYTGVLLTCTSNPLWCKNPFLGALFSASAISTGAEAVSLALACAAPSDRNEPAQTVLRAVDSAAHVAELGLMAGFLRFAGPKAKTLRTGKMSRHHKFAVGGILTAELLKWLPVPHAVRRPVRMLAAALGLAAGFSTRWAMIFGGHEAAADPHTSRLVSQPADPAK